MIKFRVSPVYNFKNPTVLLNKVSTITCVKIDLIQAKIKKSYRTSSTAKNSKYWMPKIAIKNKFVRPDN